MNNNTDSTQQPRNIQRAFYALALVVLLLAVSTTVLWQVVNNQGHTIDMLTERLNNVENGKVSQAPSINNSIQVDADPEYLWNYAAPKEGYAIVVSMSNLFDVKTTVESTQTIEAVKIYIVDTSKNPMFSLKHFSDPTGVWGFPIVSGGRYLIRNKSDTAINVEQIEPQGDSFVRGVFDLYNAAK